MSNRRNAKTVLARIEECKARGLSPRQIAEAIGISEKSVSYYRNRDATLQKKKRLYWSKREGRSKRGPACDESDLDIFETDRMARLFAEAIATQAPGRY